MPGNLASVVFFVLLFVLVCILLVIVVIEGRAALWTGWAVGSALWTVRPALPGCKLLLLLLIAAATGVALIVLRLVGARLSMDRWKLEPASLWPDEVVVDPSSDPADDELLDLGNVLQFGSGTDQRGRSQLEEKIRVERDRQACSARGCWCCFS